MKARLWYRGNYQSDPEVLRSDHSKHFKCYVNTSNFWILPRKTNDEDNWLRIVARSKELHMEVNEDDVEELIVDHEYTWEAVSFANGKPKETQ